MRPGREILVDPGQFELDKSHLLDPDSEAPHPLLDLLDEMPEPKPQYTKWFYSERKHIVSWLFSGEVELPEVNCERNV